MKQYRSLLGSFKRRLKRMGSVRWSVGCNVTIQSGSVDRPAAPGSTEKQAVGRDRTACFSCGEKVARYKRSRVGFRTGESATRFTHGPEESDFDVFLVSGLRNAQVLYVPTYNRSLLLSPSFCSTAAHLSTRYLLLPPIAPSNRIESNSF